jgi:hypothetical protein
VRELLKQNTVVQFKNLPEHCPLRDRCGTIVGVANRLPEMTVYIVLLDYNDEGEEYSCITMTEHCLEVL